MGVIVYSNQPDEYLKSDHVMDYENREIIKLADLLFEKSGGGIAFIARPQRGEEDGFVVYPDPDIKILEKLRKYRTRTALWGDFPVELAYNK